MLALVLSALMRMGHPSGEPGAPGGKFTFAKRCGKSGRCARRSKRR